MKFLSSPISLRNGMFVVQLENLKMEKFIREKDERRESLKKK